MAISKGKNLLVIAHRLSTIRNAELVLVLTEDGIEESGTHEEVVIKNKNQALQIMVKEEAVEDLSEQLVEVEEV